MYNYYISSPMEKQAGMKSSMNLEVVYRKDGFASYKEADNYRSEHCLEFDEIFISPTEEALEVGYME